MSHITVLGEGAWGSAIATLLAYNGHQVTLWCHHKDIADTIRQQRTNRFIPYITFNTLITPTTNIEEALSSEIIFEAIPVPFLRDTLERARSFIRPDHLFIMLSKGIEQTTLLLPTQILSQVAPHVQRDPVALSGPSYAYDLTQQQPTAVVVASQDHRARSLSQNILDNDFFHTTPSSDVSGVQYGGAFKNIIALGCGMLEGAGYSDNTYGWAFTQGFKELSALTLSLGGHEATIAGLAGLGDLILTCTGKQSRNRQLGKELGQGKLLTQLSSTRMPEGINTLRSVQQLLDKQQISAPFMQAIAHVVFDHKPITYLLDTLQIALRV
jgi:glycerol-3-phosphate dehydrogenase (NAD(P)+)